MYGIIGGMKKNTPVAELDTYVFIDTSNIRTSCLKTLRFAIDFKKLIKYFRNKYKYLCGVYYYEGISNNDQAKSKEFRKLMRIGYDVRSLSRKAYVHEAVYKDIKCRKCGNTWRTRIMKRMVSLKSNVDVYLATDLLKVAYLAKKEVHIIIVSCDGDYAEMIKSAIEVNSKVLITVMGTPVVKNELNTFSMRLQELRGKIPRFNIINIDTIKDLIS